MIQYHNYDKEQHFPGLLDNDDRQIGECAHYISTKKSCAAYLDGSTVFLVIGISVKKMKKYFIWTLTDVDDFEFLEDESLSYNITGQQEYIKPVCLNEIPGFTEFLKKIGNFAYGLTKITHLPFTQQMIDISVKNKADESMSCEEFLNLYKKSLTSSA